MFLKLVLAVVLSARAFAGTLSLTETSILLKQVDLDSALVRDHLGYPRLDQAKVDLGKISSREHRAVILENEVVRLTLLPEMGRVFSFYSKITAHELLWTNAIARPIFNQQNDLGWWMVRGGIEYTIPRGEHGTTWALPWTYRITQQSGRRKAVSMAVREPRTGLLEEIEISLRPEECFFTARISVKNPSRTPVRASHWVTPMWAPGGRGEITPKTEFIVPCDGMIVADKNFNQWMLGERVQSWDKNPLRFAENWRSIGDLLVRNFTAGFYSAFCHEANEGIVRVFDPEKNPGMDIWTWGYPPPASRQKDYSLVPNLGYVEMWGGTARDFSDQALPLIQPGETVSWTEQMYGYSGTAGLTMANEYAAVTFWQNEPAGTLDLGIFAARPLPKAALEIRSGRERLWKASVALASGQIFRTNLVHRGPAELTVSTKGKLLLRTPAISRN